MSKFLDAMQPWLEQVFPEGSKFSDDGVATIRVTMPRVQNWAYEKVANLHFDPAVVDQIEAEGAGFEDSIAERVGLNACARLSRKFADWETNNVQIRKMQFGLEMLDPVK